MEYNLRILIGEAMFKIQGNRIVISNKINSTSSIDCKPEPKLTRAFVSNTFGIDWLKFIKTVNSIPNIILVGEVNN